MQLHLAQQQRARHAGIARVFDHAAVARLEQHAQHEIEHLQGPVDDHHLRGPAVDGARERKVARGGLAQRRDAGRRTVAQARAVALGMRAFPQPAPGRERELRRRPLARAQQRLRVGRRGVRPHRSPQRRDAREFVLRRALQLRRHAAAQPGRQRGDDGTAASDMTLHHAFVAQAAERRIDRTARHAPAARQCA
jgi:hypothetical protein